ncbi:hypothetical protein MBLNU13_g10426t1 [Cladosporium sp. NU13]
MDSIPKNKSVKLHRHKRSSSRQEVIVVCLPDYSVSLEYDTNLEQYKDHLLASDDKGLPQAPWNKFKHLEVPEGDQEKRKSSYTYPVDIRLDQISPNLWWKRMFRRVVSVRVYNAPLVKAE